MTRSTAAIAILISGIGIADCGGPSAALNRNSPLAITTTSTRIVEAELTERLKTLCDGAGSDIGVAVINVETGQRVVLEDAKQLPLYSVFKLPLAIAVLKDVEEKRLSLDRKVRVTPDDVAPGAQFNTDLWHKPVDKTVAELLELSIVRSDNTSSDKLLELVGGPATVTARMRALGLSNINIQYTVREFAAQRDKPNTGTASDLARLLSILQRGEILRSAQTEMLLGFLTRAMTGEHRLRGDLPAGTPVADKTGTGEAGSTINDVGLITLPEGKGHLAMAVLISGSKLTADAQEKLIAGLARAAYDAYVTPGRTAPSRTPTAREGYEHFHRSSLTVAVLLGGAP